MEVQFINGKIMKTKLFIITGASRGIGKLLFDTYRKKNFKVIGVARTENLDKDLYSGDVCDLSFIERLKKKLNGDENIVLINCAGINYNSFAHKSDMTKWKKVIETNLIGSFQMIQAFLPIMRDVGYGTIINMSSITAQQSTPGVSSYSSSKSALWGLVRSISIENASKGITINNINLGYSEIGMIKEVPADYLNKIIKSIPVGRLANSSEIKLTVEFLIKNRFITGSNIDLNGGMV